MVRVRFAPSPTGYLHLGGARTALFSWLWARSQGGRFVLRIEDTDRARHDEASAEAILESLRWLGLDWDEGPEVGGDFGPYFQSERRDIYRLFAEKLVARGVAYRCYATPEELKAARDAHTASGSKAPFKYPGLWRDRTDWPDNQPYAIRLKVDARGQTGWNDLVKGRIDIPNQTQQDFILLRSDGLPLYNFGCVVDDLSMKIDVVARGDDHVINTPPQLLIYEALGQEPPRFAHLPMILSPNGEKLSKRHAAVSVLEYRDAGYLPEAVLNYLARLGWSHGDQEIFSKEELVRLFSWESVGTSAARYDAKKFLHVQATHLRQQSPERLAELVRDALSSDAAIDTRWLEDGTLDKAIATAISRAATVPEVVDTIRYALLPKPVLDASAGAKFLTEAACALLADFATLLEGLPTWESSALEAATQDWLAARDLSMKALAQPARVALTGQSKNAGLFEILDVLGLARSRERLRAAGSALPSGDEGVSS